MKHNSGVAGSKQSGSCHAATAGMDVLPLCPLSMAAVPLAGSAVVFHYPRLSQSPMSPGLEQFGEAWCSVAPRQAVRHAAASSAFDCLAAD